MKSINNKKHLIQHLRSQHTPSGNPQRLWIIYDATTGYTKKVFDDGYRGQPENTDRMLLLPTFDIPKSEYHHLVKKYKACNLFDDFWI